MNRTPSPITARFVREGGALLLLAASACVQPSARHKAAGNVLFNAKDWDGALAEYRIAEAESPRDPDARVLVASALFEKLDYAGAEREYRAALALAPVYSPALRGLSEVAMHHVPPDLAGAVADLAEVVKASPNDHDALAALGELELQAGDLHGADDSLLRAIHLGADPRSLYTLGLVFIAEGDEPAALSTFARLDEVAPGSAQASYGRAQAEAKAGQRDRALDDLALALSRGIPDLATVRSDENLASLRDDPRFATLLAGAGRAAPAIRAAK